MSNVWFSSDFHYSHSNIAGPSVSKWKRGYRNFDSVEEMNRTIIDNINKVVGQDDILYCLGDWSFSHIYNIYAFRKQLVCNNIHLILGNHDKHIRKNNLISKHDGSLIEPRSLFSSVQEIWEGYINKQYFYMSHYAHRVWNGSHKGSIHIYAHSHGTLPGIGKSMDVGIDTHPEFRPYSIDEVISILSKKSIYFIDHHDSNTN